MDRQFARVGTRHPARLASIGLSIDLPLIDSQFGLGGVSDFHFTVIHRNRGEPLRRFAYPCARGSPRAYKWAERA